MVNPLVLIGLGLYLALMLGIGLYASRRVKGSVDYIVAGKRLPLLLCTAPLAAPSSKAMKSVSITPRAADAPPPPPPETQVSTESLDTACTKATKTCVIA